MINFLSENPLVVLVFVLIIMSGLAFFFVSAKDSGKKEKSSSGKDDKSSDYISKHTKKDKKSKALTKKEKKALRSKTKKTIEKVYGSESGEEAAKNTGHEMVSESETDIAEVSGADKQPFKSINEGTIKPYSSGSSSLVAYKKEQTMSEEELLEKMKFVPTSSKVSKLERVVPAKTSASTAPKINFDLPAGSVEASADSNINKLAASGVSTTLSSEGAPAASGPVPVQSVSNLGVSPRKSKYFDHSTRLSKSIASGSFDDMFRPHISEKYMNMDVTRHLDVGDEFSESLYARTSNMFANSGARVSSEFDDGDGSFGSPSKSYRYDRDMMKDWIERKKREEVSRLMSDSGDVSAAEPKEGADFNSDDLKLSARGLFVTDAVMNRKGKKTGV